MKKIKYCLLALLCPILCAAQLKPMAVGDTIPDHAFTNLVNFCEPSLKISTYKDKLVILDFWASWCASCKRGLEKLDSLAQNYPSNMAILLVNSKQTGDNAAKIVNLYHNPRNRLFTHYPTIIEDTLLSAWFPHQAVPHYVWLYNGVVRSISSWRDLKPENVDAVLNGSSFIPKK